MKRLVIFNSRQDGKSLKILRFMYKIKCDSKIILALLLKDSTDYDFSNYSCKNVCVIFLIIFFRKKIWNYKMLRIWLGYQPQRIKSLASVRYKFFWKYFFCFVKKKTKKSWCYQGCAKIEYRYQLDCLEVKSSNLTVFW